MKKEIKAFFKKHPTVKIKSKMLAKKLKANAPHEYSELKHVLHTLYEEDYLGKSGKRFFLNRQSTNKLVGMLQIVKNGAYGFVVLADKKLNDIFIPERYLGTAFHGDKVEVSLFAKQMGKSLEGEIIKIIERNKNEIVGTLSQTDSFYYLIPDEITIHRDIYIPSKFLNGAKKGDKVVVGELEWKSTDLNPEGKVVSVLGKAGSYDAEVLSIAHEMKLKKEFPKEVIKQAENIDVKINDDEIENRLDLREELIFTIDPDDAKDFDDAVSITELKNGNFEVGIHIADVSHYVKIGSPIYNEAYDRATSVYFVGKVIPMLPERLSNKICSLVPNEDRLTFSVIAEITEEGKVEKYKISKTVINSKRRFTYDEVQTIIDKGEGELIDKITALNKLARTIRKNRMDTGSINFITPEVKFILDDGGIPIDIKLKEVKESHQLIEEYMLLANRIIAKHMQPKTDQIVTPFVYRVHDLPDKDKLYEFAEFVKSLGYSFDPGGARNSRIFKDLLEQVHGKVEEPLVNTVAIRSMAKAIYTTNNIGHYGLAFPYYTHFTSPIRRFPDLVVHQIIFNDLLKNKTTVYGLEQLESICDHASLKERNAIEAERLSVKIKHMQFLKGKIGHEFRGVISGITNFGIFVELEDTLAEGLVPLRNMEDDYYVLDEKNYSLVGRATGQKYRLGDEVNVKVVRIDEEKREIDFGLLHY